MAFHSSRFVILVVTVSVTLFAGCASTQTSRFYTLSAMDVSSSSLPQAESGMDVAIGVGPIKIADYLDRSEVVTRDKQNGIQISEFDRWAGQLKDSFMGVLSENLSLLLSTDQVVLYPWRSSIPIDYKIEVEVIQFDGEPSAGATLVARWIILEGGSKKVLLMRRSKITESVSASDYSAVVAAQSRLLVSLSREISSQIKDLHSMKSRQ